MITRMEVFLNKKGKAAEQKFAEMVIIYYCFIIFLFSEDFSLPMFTLMFLLLVEI